MLDFQLHSKTIQNVALTVMFILLQQFLTAQGIHLLPPNQPEQDACNALVLCGTSFSTPYSYQGIGINHDLLKTPCYPGDGRIGGEVNSLWLKLGINTPGKLVFKIVPNNPEDDYDFAVLNTTHTTCDKLVPEDVVRCNFNNNLPGTNVNGIIGLSTSSIVQYVENGSAGSSYCQAIDALAGETYLVMINNFGDYLTQNTISQGFTIDFSGSTAVFNQNDAPALSGAVVACSNKANVTVLLNTEVLCSSIAADGSDFNIDAPVTIKSAAGVNCNGSNGYTNSIQLSLSAPLPVGTYLLHAKSGSDGNTLLNLCNVALTLPSGNTTITVLPPGSEVTDNETICYEELPYVWNGINVAQGGARAAIYTTTSTAGCDSTTVLNLTVSKSPVHYSSSAEICRGKVYQLPWDSLTTTAGTFTHAYKNRLGCDSVVEDVTVLVHTPLQIKKDTGFCINKSIALSVGDNFATYLWNTGSTQSTITVDAPGSYTSKATDVFGCTANDTFLVSPYPAPAATFSRQTVLCDNSPVTITAGNNFLEYLWNDGSTSPTITISRPGMYWVTLTDAHTCVGTDTTELVLTASPSHFLPITLSKCFYDEALITPQHFFVQYLWSNGATSRQTTVAEAGIYWLKATDGNGCTGIDSITIKDSACAEFVSFPAAFSPNGDGKNDVFRASIAGKLSYYTLAVYNRLGNLCFKTDDVAKGWDGATKSVSQPPGTYIYTCRYQLSDQSVRIRKGTLVLFR